MKVVLILKLTTSGLIVSTRSNNVHGSEAHWLIFTGLWVDPSELTITFDKITQYALVELG